MPIWGPLALSAGASLADALFGQDDQFKMSPEQRALYQKLMGEYSSGSFGYSAAEKMGMQKKLKTGLTEESQARTGASLASLGRRGVLDAGSAAGITTGIQSDYGKAYGEGLTDIELSSAEEGRRRKSELENALMGASQGQFVEGGSMAGDIGNMAGNWMYYELMKEDKKKNPTNYGRGPWGWRP